MNERWPPLVANAIPSRAIGSVRPQRLRRSPISPGIGYKTSMAPLGPAVCLIISSTQRA